MPCGRIVERLAPQIQSNDRVSHLMSGVAKMKRSLWPLALVLSSAALTGCGERSLPTVMVSCVTPHPGIGNSFDIYEFYGVSPSDKCMQTNKGAGPKEQEQVTNETGERCHAEIKQQLLTGVTCTRIY